MRQVTLYTRDGCHLCEEARKALDGARAREPFDLQIVDIDSDVELRRLYDYEVPVIAIDGVKAFKYRVSEAELLKKLRARRTPES